MSTDPEDQPDDLSDPSETPEESTGDTLEGTTSDDVESGDRELPDPPDEGIPGD
jgi:hypothetical protein